ncbi:MAG: hypothetical protein RBT76_12875 [candidate division Zixibacteria bacterium]|jgi:hypothetical protein|nr:hypothetical protein [candidate division Zixibacteria bacterium]
MHIRLLLTVVAILFVGSIAIGAGSITLTQSIDRTEAPFEEQAVLEFVLTWSSPQSAYRFERPLQPVLDKLRVGRFATSISSTGSGSEEVTTKRFEFSLIPTESGIGRVEPVTIAFLSWPDSIPGEVVTEPVSITIAAPRPPDAQPDRLPVWLLVLAGACVAAGGGAVYAYRRRRARAEMPEKTPAERLLERLSTLQKEAGSDLKRFQTGLFSMLVDYLEQQFDLPLAGKTADEVASAIAHTALSDAQRDSIVGWLQRAEREKYQPVNPSPGETVRLANDLRSFFDKM